MLRLFSREYIEVDIYGGCGTFKCFGALNLKTDECVKMLSDKYKFYLALENS